MELTVIIGVVGTVSSIVFAYIGYQKGTKSQAYRRGGLDSEVKADIQYIKRRSDDMLIEQKDTNKSLGHLTERVTRVEESSKQAHKRIDTLEQKHMP